MFNFDNAGRKLQYLAIITMGVGILGSLVSGIVVWYNSWELGFLYFLLIAGVGSLSSYISSLFIYAFGELVENVASIEDDTGHFRKKNMKPDEEMETEKTVKFAQADEVGTCELCGLKETKLVNARIEDDLGIRYRKICNECFSKNNCQLAEK